MAYAGTVTVKRLTVSGRRHLLITIAETEAAATSEATIPAADMFDVGTIVSVKSTLTAGTGTTVDPRCGRATGWSDATQDAIYSNGSAAANIDTRPGSVFSRQAGQALYWRSTPNDATADHSISTEILIVEGHQAV